MKAIKSTRVLTPQGEISGYICYDEDQILSVTAMAPQKAEIYDAGDLIVCPGFIDVHNHGASDYDFSDADAEGIGIAIDFHLQHGTTTIVPTVTSVSCERTEASLEEMTRFLEKGTHKANVVGVHLEGPYFSPAQCGAQSAEYLTPPDEKQYMHLLRKFPGLIKRWSYAPELDKDQKFARALAENGVQGSIGHSDALQSDCVAAYENGTRCVTHLYSCTSTITRDKGFRRLGIIETAYLMDEIYVEMIADGCHLPPDLIRMIYKIKGSDRICMVTDAMRATGVEGGQSFIGGRPCIIEDGVAKLPDRSAFAGSIATTDRLLRTCVLKAGIPLAEGVKMLTETPAKLLGIHAGVIEAGARPDFVILNEELAVQRVIVGGEFVK